MLVLIFMLRVRRHRHPLRLDVPHPFAPDLAPPPAPIDEPHIMTEVSPVMGHPKKKALLIGVCGTGNNALKGPDNDVKAIRNLLIRQ